MEALLLLLRSSPNKKPKATNKTPSQTKIKQMTQVNGTVVLYPSMGVGHLVPMVELAKHFQRHGVSVVIAVVDSPMKATISADAIPRLIASNPSISFHKFPPISSPNAGADPFKDMLDVVRLNNVQLCNFLRSLPSVAALIIDFFCADALDVTTELKIPAYSYFTSGAAALAVFLHLPYLHSTNSLSFKDMGKTTLINFQGMPLIRTTDMPQSMQDREKDSYKIRLHLFSRMPEATGILINSFEGLEAKAVRALKNGDCRPDRSTPPVYCIGPLINGGGEKKGGEERHACLEWLDVQPERSVVFLCFGSMGAFSAPQLTEMARGLESSGQRFLWAVRSPPNEDPKKWLEARPEPDLEALLPEGFLERTKDRGMVVKMWAPQAEVLRHEAVGAFVTHCGWNSSLEAVSAGVPLVCWPLYAEQRLNKVLLVEEMKIGVEMKGYDEELVKAEEIEAKVKLIMQSEEGKEVRKRMATAKEKALAALEEGGSSRLAFLEFLSDLEKK